jgi:ABC-2 type transport system permease protein
MATIIIPVLALIVARWLNLMSVSSLLPGILAIAIIAAGMVNLGIATAYERYYGVLKRLGSSPLSRLALISAKILSILALEVIQVIILVLVAWFAYDWRLEGSLLTALLAIILGTIMFSAFGLWMAGTLRSELTLVLANGLFLVFMFLSGGMVPLDRLPVGLATLSTFLPATALTQALQQSLTPGSSVPIWPLLTLGIWAVFFVLLASRTFKWE